MVEDLAWDKAPMPWRLHRCHVQSAGMVGSGTTVERCACGAIKVNGMAWRNRNSRRKHRRDVASGFAP